MNKAENLVLEFNEKFKKATTEFSSPSGNVLTITPPLDQDYWIFRVVLHKEQAIVAFPKFMTLGIGFAVEDDDWNTNLPYSCEAEKIYSHISKNKKYDEITKEICLQAIALIKEACVKYKSNSN